MVEVDRGPDDGGGQGMMVEDTGIIGSSRAGAQQQIRELWGK